MSSKGVIDIIKLKRFLDNLTIKIEYYLDNAVDIIYKILDAFFLRLNTGLAKIMAVITKMFVGINKIYLKNGKLIRTICWPWISIIPFGYKIYLKHKIKSIPLLRPGVQMVRAKVGGGKSLTSFILAQIVLERTGHPSYMTAQVEKPKLSEDGKYWYVYHPVIDLANYFYDGKQWKRFNTNKYKNMHKDEDFLRHPPRLNKTTKYNNSFIPEHKHELVMRHDGFETITKYSQHPKLDGLAMETIDLMHEVETIKDIPVKRYIEEGSLKYIPIKLKFESYSLDVDFEGKIKRKLFKKWSLPVKYEDLIQFDTYAERNMMDHLPYDFK